MKKSEFLTVLDEILELDPGTIKGNEELIALESWNSLSVLGFISFADKNFGKIISPLDIQRAKTIGDLIVLLGNSIS